MLRKKLFLIQSLIIVLSMLVLFLGTMSGLRRLFYRESALLYDTLLEQSYKSIHSVFSSAQNLALEVCVNAQLQNLLKEQYGHEEWDGEATRQLDRVFRSTFATADYAATLYPVTDSGQLLIKDAEGVLSPSGIWASDYPILYDFLWEFRPAGSEIIRVTKKMYDNTELSRLMGVVTVEFSILNITEPFWTFAAQTGTDSRLYLLDAQGDLLFPYSSVSNEWDGQEISSLKAASYDLRNQRIRVSHSFLQNHWRLVGVFSGASLLKGSSDVIRNSFIIGIALMLVGLLLTYLAATRLTAPIMKLAEWMKRSSESRTYQKLTPKRPPDTTEVAVLYDTFNDLMEVIQQSLTDIRLAGEREVKNEFLLLQSQINPHFLYNTLDSIGWIAMQHGAWEVRDMVIYLVGVLRNGLNNGDPLIRVENEVEQVRCYLNIMNIRYPDCYEVSYTVEDGVENYLIIKQLLQPLVENAIQHGFYTTNTHGLIEISITRDEQSLLLRVSNNGEPADLQKIEELLHGNSERKNKHYGIRNVNERLMKLYGEECGLRFFIEDGRTVALIALPLDKLSERFE